MRTCVQVLIKMHIDVCLCICLQAYACACMRRCEGSKLRTGSSWCVRSAYSARPSIRYSVWLWSCISQFVWCRRSSLSWPFLRFSGLSCKLAIGDGLISIDGRRLQQDKAGMLSQAAGVMNVKTKIEQSAAEELAKAVKTVRARVHKCSCAYTVVNVRTHTRTSKYRCMSSFLT